MFIGIVLKEANSPPVKPPKKIPILTKVPVYATHNPILGLVTESYEKLLAAKLNPAHIIPETTCAKINELLNRKGYFLHDEIF